MLQCKERRARSLEYLINDRTIVRKNDSTKERGYESVGVSFVALF